MAFIRKHLFVIITTFVGGILGFLYWRFIGCESGTCPIKSVWYMSTGYGIVLGYLVGDLLLGIYRKRKEGRLKSKD